MITDANKAELTDLVFRALDTIEEDYGNDAELLAASLIFEVSVPDEEDEDNPYFHANWKSLKRNSPNHISGLYRNCAAAMCIGE